MGLEFAASSAFSIGIEEELIVVDPGTLALSHTAPELAERMGGTDERVQLEWYASVIELTSPPSASAPEAAAAIEQLRTRVLDAGGAALGSGTHPDGRLGDVRMVPRERFEEVSEEVGPMVLRTPEAALHVHVGMPDAETAIRVFNGLREHVPLFQALSANSPFAFGADSGYASARSILNRSYPRFEVPPAFAAYPEYAEAMERLGAAAEIDDYTRVWWEVRPHPRFGTVEFRPLDSQADARVVAGLAALVHGLALHAAEQPPAEPTARAVLSEGAYRAAALGIDATLWDGGALVPARELGRRALEIARPRARELGSDGPLDEVARLCAGGGGAARQRRLHSERGMRGLLEALRDETLGLGVPSPPLDRI